MLNKVILMGRLTADPELHQTTQNNIPVASFSIAVDRDYKANGEKETDFIDVVAWRHNAEFVNQYFKKGQMICVAGSMQTRKYQDREGKNRKAVEVVADNVYFAGSSPNGNETRSESTDNDTSDFSPSSDDFNVFP